MEENERKVSSSEDGDSSDDDVSASETELMVTSRTRRATAGNRYTVLVAQEEITNDEEDEVAMLFAEGEGEDEDFNSDEGDDDADMSSSDDDDQGPNTAVDDMEGENEIQKEAKVERAKKRKADLALTTMAGLRKKPKIDPTSIRRAPAPKPTKRKERVSWLPGSEAAPGRTSLRKQTILHRAETHAKLKENEAQRLKLKARREKREREREAEIPKEMTQADRLAEAERVEKRNAKSLNRWEAMEKKRVEEQAARLAALKERKLEGAVLTWYSSSAKYIGLKENKAIESETPPEVKKRGRKPKALLEQLAAAKLAQTEASASVRPTQNQPIEIASRTKDASPQVHASGDHVDGQIQSEVVQISNAATTNDVGQIEPSTEDQSRGEGKTSKVSEDAFLTGIHEYASLEHESASKPTSTKQGSPEIDLVMDDAKPSQPQSTSPASIIPPLAVDGLLNRSEQKDKLLVPAEKEEEAKTNSTSAVEAASIPEEVSNTGLLESTQEARFKSVDDVSTEDTDNSTILKKENHADISDAIRSSQSISNDNNISENSELHNMQAQPLSSLLSSPMVPADANHALGVATPLEPPVEVISTRNLVILERFEDISDQARYDLGLFYNNRKAVKPTKQSQELCPVTGLPARYRDPQTGIGYANATAYKKLQELKNHQFTWSSMLGCYVGKADAVARGVPDGFLAN